RSVATMARSRYCGGNDSHKQRAVNSSRSPTAIPTTCRVRLSRAVHTHHDCCFSPMKLHSSSTSILIWPTFFLGQQSWLEQLLLQGLEIGLGITPETPALPPSLPTGLHLTAKRLPLATVRSRQLRRTELTLAGRRRGQQTRLATQHQTGRRSL